MKAITASFFAGLVLLFCGPAKAQAERVWLTHRSNNPSKLVVSWTTLMPSESVVRFGTSAEYGQESRRAGTRTLHHVEIPIAVKGTTYHYSVGAGEHVSPVRRQLDFRFSDN